MAVEESDVDLAGTVRSVADLNAAIADRVEDAEELQFDYLIGDVSNTFDSDGTLYFTLFDEGAGITCIVFSSVRKRLHDIDDDQRVAIKGTLNYYEVKGQCSIYVSDVVRIGDSSYRERIEKLRKRLAEEGLFDEERKRELPFLPRTIGLVTAHESDAETDAITAIHGRFPTVDIHLRDTRVQGDDAPEDLVESIMYFDATGTVDLIVVTRGGGEERDFEAFNTEEVARAIAGSETPVVTALGHESDEPIADMVADARAMTPTELGEVVVPERTRLLERVSELRDRMEEHYARTSQSQVKVLRDGLRMSYSRKVSQRTGTLRSAINDEYRRVTNARIDRLRGTVNTSYTNFKDRTLDALLLSVDTAYENSVKLRIERRRTNVEHEYNQTVRLILERRRSEVRAAYESFRQRREHEERTADLRSRERRYRIAILVLVVVLLGTIGYLLYLAFL